MLCINLVVVAVACQKCPRIWSTNCRVYSKSVKMSQTRKWSVADLIQPCGEAHPSYSTSTLHCSYDAFAHVIAADGSLAGVRRPIRGLFCILWEQSEPEVAPMRKFSAAVTDSAGTGCAGSFMLSNRLWRQRRAPKALMNRTVPTNVPSLYSLVGCSGGWVLSGRFLKRLAQNLHALLLLVQ